jgi:hypothetical protein
VDPITPVQRLDGDYFGSWSPPDDNGWQLAAADPLLGVDLERCIEGTSTDWWGADGGHLEIYWVRCESSDVAFAFQNEKWTELTDITGLSSVFGNGFDRFARYSPDGTVTGVDRSWVQGDLYVNVQRTCPAGDLDTCSRATAVYAMELAQLLPGEVTQNLTLVAATGQAGWLFIALPVLTFLALLLPQRIFFWIRSRGYEAEDSNQFTSVDRLVRKVRIGRLVRRSLLTILVIGAWFAAFWPSASLGLWQLAWLFLSPFVFFAAFGWLLRLVWRPHPLLRVAKRRTKPTVLGVIGGVIRAVATGFAVLSVTIYFLASLMLISDRLLTPATVRSQLDAALEPGADPFYVAYSLIRGFAHALDEAGTYFLVFVLLLPVPVFLAYLLDRFGKRLARRGLHVTLQQDNRPYFLYLRGFDEDRLRVDESVGRSGFLELFTPFGRPRFEEVLVEYLGQFGPVIAISGTKKRISDLGAAKVSLGNDEWRDRVREWTAGARAVVMSATPGEVRAGLEWEMQHVSMQQDRMNLILVLAPWPREELARRWSGFLTKAAELPLFRPLVDSPMPTGVEVLTYTPAGGWHGYGGRRRWDWTYAASIISVMQLDEVGVDVEDAATPATIPA